MVAALAVAYKAVFTEFAGAQALRLLRAAPLALPQLPPPEPAQTLAALQVHLLSDDFFIPFYFFSFD